MCDGNPILVELGAMIAESLTSTVRRHRTVVGNPSGTYGNAEESLPPKNPTPGARLVPVTRLRG